MVIYLLILWDFRDAQPSPYLVINSKAKQNPGIFPTSALSKPRQEVAVRPEFQQKPTDTTVTEGEEVKLLVKVTGTPDPEVEWQKDGKPIRDGRRLKVDKGRDSVHSIRIPRAETTDQGEYTCTAKNKAGKASCSAKLSVEGTCALCIVYLLMCRNIEARLPLLINLIRVN